MTRLTSRSIGPTAGAGLHAAPAILRPFGCSEITFADPSLMEGAIPPRATAVGGNPQFRSDGFEGMNALEEEVDGLRVEAAS